MGGQALAGIRVLELAQMVSGPACGKFLSDMGAEVIKIEPPGNGDVARRAGPFPGDIPDPEKSALFLYLNTNKLGITLDVKSATGQHLFKQLVRVADVMIEDTPAGFLASLGLGYPFLERVNPTLVMVSITPFGQTGPHSKYKGYGLVIYHMGIEGWLTPSGLANRMFPEREPLKAGGNIPDYYVGVSAGLGLMGAVFARDASGVGQHVDISGQEAILSATRRSVQGYANLGTVEDRNTRDFAYGGVIPCKDGYIEGFGGGEVHWQRMIEMLGNPEWAFREEFSDPDRRRQQGDEINEHLFAWAKDKTMDEIYRAGFANRIPVGKHNSTLDVLVDQHEEAREFFAEVDLPGVGRTKMAKGLARMSATPWQLERPAPHLGEHNPLVFSDLLGLRREELVKLYQARVV